MCRSYTVIIMANILHPRENCCTRFSFFPLGDLTEHGDNMTIINHEMRLHEINTLDWEELLVPDDLNKLSAPDGGS